MPCGNVIFARKLAHDGAENLGQMREVAEVSYRLANFAYRQPAVSMVAPGGIGKNGLALPRPASPPT